MHVWHSTVWSNMHMCFVILRQMITTSVQCKCTHDVLCLIWLKQWSRPFHISCKAVLSYHSTHRLKWLLAHTDEPSVNRVCSRSRCEWLHCCAHSGAQLGSEKTSIKKNWTKIKNIYKGRGDFIKTSFLSYVLWGKIFSFLQIDTIMMSLKQHVYKTTVGDS